MERVDHKAEQICAPLFYAGRRCPIAVVSKLFTNFRNEVSSDGW